MQDDQQEQAVIGAAAVGGEGSAGRVLIAPWGQVRSSNGDFILDEQAAEVVLRAFEAQGTDLPVDYEHQSLGGSYSSPTGQAPAAGWIKALQLISPGSGDGEPGLYAEIEWTPAAQAKLAAREYRYLSPVVIVRKQDRRMVALHSAALTNKPAICGMRPIINREQRPPAEPADAGPQTDIASNNSNKTMEATQMENATSTEPAAQPNAEDLPAVPQASDQALEVLRLRLGLQEEADGPTVILAAEQRLADLTDQLRQREAEQRIAAATREGRLIPVQREWALALALRDPAAFDEWAATAPVVVSLGRTEPPEPADADRGRAAVVASARAAWQSEPHLATLTSEEAWVRDALREAGFEREQPTA